MAERKPKQGKPAPKEREEKDAKKRAKDLAVPEEKGGKVKGGAQRVFSDARLKRRIRAI